MAQKSYRGGYDIYIFFRFINFLIIYPGCHEI